MLSQVSLLNMGLNGAASIAGSKNSSSGTNASFESLIKGLFSQGVANPSELVAQTVSSLAGTSSYRDGYDTPLDKFRKAVEESGQSADDLNLPKEQSEKLEKALVDSGYKRTEAKAAISQASDGKGNVNLGKLFKALGNFKPSEVNGLTIQAQDLPVLLQVLRDFGVSEEKLTAFANQVEATGSGSGDAAGSAAGTIKLTGLANLLAGVDESGYQMDRGVLTDLLKRIGLDSKEIEALLSRNLDSQQRLTPSAMLKVLQTAAANQDGSLADSFRSLAASVTKSPQATGPAFDAASLAAKVQTFLQKGQGPKAAAFTEALEAKVKLIEQGAELVKTSEAAARNEAKVLPRGASQTARAGVDTSQADAKSGTGAAKAAVKEGVQTNTAIDPSKAVKASGKGLAAGGESAQTQQTTTARSTTNMLPAQVVRQVAYQIGQMTARQQNTLRLSLNPAELGKVELKLDVSSGTVKATMVAETVAAKQTLEAGMEDLKNQLTAQGLKVEKIEVMLNTDAQRQEAGNANPQTGNGRRGRGGGFAAGEGQSGDSADATAVLAAVKAEQNGRINLIA